MNCSSYILYFKEFISLIKLFKGFDKGSLILFRDFESVSNSEHVEYSSSFSISILFLFF